MQNYSIRKSRKGSLPFPEAIKKGYSFYYTKMLKISVNTPKAKYKDKLQNEKNT